MALVVAPELAVFQAFPKLPRLNRDMVVTEKIDGTNACVGITEDGQVFAQSRKRIITPEQDNFGFARWVHENADELSVLGPGYHYGEWWGLGIQRGYGLSEKRFSLFAVDRYEPEQLTAPGLGLVPVLGRYTFDTEYANDCARRLAEAGSAAAPGFFDPEGVVAFHTAARVSFKVTIHDDQNPKSIAAGA